MGETIPYLRTDYDTRGNVTYQAVFTFPVVGADGSRLFYTLKSNNGNFSADWQYNFSEATDGYDLIAKENDRYSVIRTSDGGCLDQVFEKDSTSRFGGWLLFDGSQPSASELHSLTITRISANRPAGCAATTSGSEILAVWNPPAPIGYETGKVLDTIVSYHYAHRDLSRKDNALERFFFTDEYGFTRWEAW